MTRSADKPNPARRGDTCLQLHGAELGGEVIEMERGGGHGHDVAECDHQVSPTEGAEEAHVVRAVGEDTRPAAADLLAQTRLPFDGHLRKKETAVSQVVQTRARQEGVRQGSSD